jgi:hypothetical protein
MDESLIAQVRHRANDACEYCRMPRALYPTMAFPIDHIIAQQHGGPTALGNLALACLHDNGPTSLGSIRSRENLPSCSIHDATNGNGVFAGKVRSWWDERQSVELRSRCWR